MKYIHPVYVYEQVSSPVPPLPLTSPCPSTHGEAFTSLANNYRTLFPYSRTFAKKINLGEVRSLPLNIWKTMIHYDLSRPMSQNIFDTSTKVRICTCLFM